MTTNAKCNRKPLPTLQQLKANPQTKAELARQVLPKGLTYDLTLPQPWLDRFNHHYDLIRSTVVWAYPPHNCMFGEPMALCQEADAVLRLS